MLLNHAKAAQSKWQDCSGRQRGQLYALSWWVAEEIGTSERADCCRAGPKVRANGGVTFILNCTINIEFLNIKDGVIENLIKVGFLESDWVMFAQQFWKECEKVGCEKCNQFTRSHTITSVSIDWPKIHTFLYFFKGKRTHKSVYATRKACVSTLYSFPFLQKYIVLFLSKNPVCI